MRKYKHKEDGYKVVATEYPDGCVLVRDYHQTHDSFRSTYLAIKDFLALFDLEEDPLSCDICHAKDRGLIPNDITFHIIYDINNKPSILCDRCHEIYADLARGRKGVLEALKALAIRVRENKKS